MSFSFTYDVFLSHSPQDRAVARDLAERLRQDGLRVRLGEEEADAEEGLERSRALVLCLSAHAFGEGWAQLEAGTFRFRDPLNPERRFIPLRLDGAPLPTSLAQFLSIDWREQKYEELLTACRPPSVEPVQETPAARARLPEKILSLGYAGSIHSVAFSPDGRRALSGAGNSVLRIWDLSELEPQAEAQVQYTNGCGATPQPGRHRNRSSSKASHSTP
jgi:hypothetical protein